MITMIDYGIGNYRSVQKALEAVGATVYLTHDTDEIAQAEKLILPGVGAFGASVDALRARGQDEAIYTAVKAGTPLLGICVGMQLLLDSSEELGEHCGLGLISGRVRKFSAEYGLKIPHIGWNQLHHEHNSPLLAGIEEGDYAYFVHSFYCDPIASADMLASTDYGQRYASIISRANVFGIQFHAEKSQKVGLQILRNFAEL